MKIVLVLGSGVGPDGSIGDAQKLQIKKAHELINSGAAEFIVTCGSHSYKAEVKPPLSEALAYKNYAVSIGIPEHQILMEDTSQDTMGNFLFAKSNIMMPNHWTDFYIIPGINHSDERVNYIARKVFGPSYTWTIVRIGTNEDPHSLEREQKSLKIIKDIIDPIDDSDHEEFLRLMHIHHPAFNPNSKLKLEDLKKELS